MEKEWRHRQRRYKKCLKKSKKIYRTNRDEQYNNWNKNTPERINIRIHESQEWISELEDRMVEITAAEQNKEKRMKRNEDSLRDLWDNIKHTNILSMEVLEGEDREKGSEKIYEELIAENSPIVGNEAVIQVQEVQRAPSRKNPRRNMPRDIVIKLTKIKDKENIKSNKGKAKITYREFP